MSLKIVHRHASPNLYLRGTVRGITVDESTGTNSKTVAEAIRIKREQELLDRSVFGQRATVSWLEAAVDYLEHGGEARYMERLNNHFGTIPLARINQAAVDRAARLIYPRAAPGTLNRQVYTPVSAVLKRAAKRGLCEYWPVERLKEPKGRVRWISIEEANARIGACSTHMAPLVTFLFYTGARLSEALYLAWQEVDLTRAHVTFLDTKSDEDRGVPLHPRVVAALANLRHRDGTVFRRPDGKPYEAKAEGGGQIKTGFNAACRRSKISNFTPHDCRHTWATWHYAANRDLGALMRLGGWRSERMVLRYAHINVGELAASIDVLPWGNSGKHQIEIKERRKKSAGSTQ